MFKRPIRVLLVEDNPGDAKLAEIALQECPEDVKLFAVDTGAEALDFLFKRGVFRHVQTPDLVLLDLNLPKTGGQEVLKKVKSDPELMKIPILILTSSASPDEIARCYDLHCNGFFTKPLEFGEFVDMMKFIEETWMGGDDDHRSLIKSSG